MNSEFSKTSNKDIILVIPSTGLPRGSLSNSKHRNSSLSEEPSKASLSSSSSSSNQRYNNTKALDTFSFAKDFLPKRFDRYCQSDLPAKVITLLLIAFDVFMFVLFVKFAIDVVKGPMTWFIVMELTFMCILFIFGALWVDYKLSICLQGFYRLFMDLDVIKRNDKYYSGLEIPDFFIESRSYPHITLQCPVFKESLEHTIRPTLLHCVREAMRYHEETGAHCNIIVCDDGYNCIPEDEREARFRFYEEHGIAFTARPHPSKLKRHGRFKKAGNLNFSQNFSNAAKFADMAESEEDRLANERRRDKWIALDAKYYGDIEYGDYIFLIDSDTRMPNHPPTENGCMKRLAKEMMFDGQQVMFIQCHTGPYLSTKSEAEKSIFHHTCGIYTAITLGTSMRLSAPLIGHNAFLNRKAMEQVAMVDSRTKYRYYWAEDRISEDFDLMMRAYERGYIGRFATHTGTFLEGVSFTYMSEYFKISKFGCGAAEMLYNPIKDWCRLGIISSSIIGFIKSRQVEWYNKITTTIYVANFIALATAHWAIVYNLFFCYELYNMFPYVLLPVNLIWEGIFIWTFVGGFNNFMLGARLGYDKWTLFRQMIRELVFMACLYGSISVKLSVVCIAHLFDLNLTFGATMKDDAGRVTLMDWIRSTPIEATIYTLDIGLIAIKLLLLTPPDLVQFTIYFGVLPMLWPLSAFWAGPLIFDILPPRKNKQVQEAYNAEERMFVDKYHMHIGESKLFKSIKVGSNLKMAPTTSNNNIGSKKSGSRTQFTSLEDDDQSVSSHATGLTEMV